MCREQGRRCLLLLADSVRAEQIYPALVGSVLGDTSMPWWWAYGVGASR